MERKSFFYAMAENGGDGGMIPDVKVTKNQKVRRLSSGFSKDISNLWLAYKYLSQTFLQVIFPLL
jgi:hypothetical protein